MPIDRSQYVPHQNKVTLLLCGLILRREERVYFDDETFRVIAVILAKLLQPRQYYSFLFAVESLKDERSIVVEEEKLA